MSAVIVCGNCRQRSSCTRCPPELRPDDIDYGDSGGCQECANRYERSLTERDREVKQLQAENKFLKLTNVDREPSNTNNFEGDLKIEVQGCVLQAHRLILADKSTVFRKMLEIQMVEKETGVVRIHDTTLPIMRAVVDFCYTAEISFTAEATPEEVLKTAHKYDISHLRDICARALVTKINDKNLAQMLRLSTVCDTKELQDAALQYVKANFERVTPSVLKEVFLDDSPRGQI